MKGQLFVCFFFVVELSEKKGKRSICESGKEAPLSQPGLEPGSSACATDALPLEILGPAHIQISSVSPLRLCLT